MLLKGKNKKVIVFIKDELGAKILVGGSESGNTNNDRLVKCTINIALLVKLIR